MSRGSFQKVSQRSNERHRSHGLTFVFQVKTGGGHADVRLEAQVELVGRAVQQRRHGGTWGERRQESADTPSTGRTHAHSDLNTSSWSPLLLVGLNVCWGP